MDRRASRIVCMATAVPMAVIALATTGFSWVSLTIAPVLWLYATGVVFLLIAAASAAYRLPAPSLPFGNRRLRGAPFVVLLASVALFTILRETGACSFNLCWTDLHWQTDTSSNVSSHTRNGAREPRLAEAAVTCRVECGASTSCEAFDRFVDCTRRSTPQAGDGVQVNISAHIDPPSCFVPLFKSGDFSARVKVNIVHTFGGGDSTLDMDIDVKGESTVFGFKSCHDYLGRVGQKVAEQVVAKVNQHLSEH